MKRRLAASCIPACATLCAGAPMFDPAIDRPEEEWCYAAQSTTVIGMPFAPAPVQVTYDGAIYTRHAELAFFYGTDLHPLMARNRTFHDGGIPVVGYTWNAGGVEYGIEMFSADVAGLGRENLLQLVRVTMSNRGTVALEGVVAATTRGSAGLFRRGNVSDSTTNSTGPGCSSTSTTGATTTLSPRTGRDCSPWRTTS